MKVAQVSTHFQGGVEPGTSRVRGSQLQNHSTTEVCLVAKWVCDCVVRERSRAGSNPTKKE